MYALALSCSFCLVYDLRSLFIQQHSTKTLRAEVARHQLLSFAKNKNPNFSIMKTSKWCSVNEIKIVVLINIYRESPWASVCTQHSALMYMYTQSSPTVSSVPSYI
jgi:hypothetical protein